MGKILISGCAGFIGSHLANYYLKNGDTVIGIDNMSRNGCLLNLELLKNQNKFHFYKEDIRDFKKISDIFRINKNIDQIIHEAGQVAVTSSVTNPREDFEINALGTFNMLEATRLFSPEAFFQFASTNKVYGKMEGVDIIENNGRYEYAKFKNGINENFGLEFHSPYGCSKGAADQYVRDYSRIYGLRTVVFRQSCIYGTRQYGIEDQGWVAWFTIAAALGKPLVIYGDGKQIRDLLWIDDLVEVYVKSYENADKVSGNIFNVGGGKSNTLSLLELVNSLNKAGVLKKQPVFSKWRPGDQKVYVSDISSVQAEIQWKPETSVQSGLNKLLEWTLSNKKALRSILR